MEPLNAYNKSRLAKKLATFAFVVTASFVNATVSAEAANDGSGENMWESRVTQYVKSIDYSSYKGNVSIIQQNGNDNQASVVQSRSADYQFANFAHIYQLGDNNQASISQSNGSNIGIIVQVGNEHNAAITQKGNKFQAEINQFGFGSDITLSQSGSGLRSISIEQQNHSGNAQPVTIDTY